LQAPTIFGRPVVHIGYSVDDIEQAVTFLAESLGAGPFFLMEDINIPSLKNADGPITWHHTAAFGQCGNINIELQQTSRSSPPTRSGTPTSAATSSTTWPTSSTTSPTSAAVWRPWGCRCSSRARTGRTSRPSTTRLLGHTIEIHEDFDLFKMFRRMMREAADGWDGTDPLRPVPSELQDTLGSA
jgi:hypothetical protein